LTDGWPLRDYISPGLRVVHPDEAFPHMRPGDIAAHPWKYLRRDVPHVWYADERYPEMGFLNRDEATLLHNIALQFAGKHALEIGSWLGWSTCHLALAGVVLDVIDPAHDDPEVLGSVEQSLVACGVRERVNLARGRSPESIAQLGRKWSLFFIDGDHGAPAPLRDALACLPFATEDCAFVFHDVAAPDVADAVRALAERGFHVVIYQTAQLMALAWRGDITPVAHVPDRDVAWQLPPHLVGLPISGVDFVPPARTTYPQLRDLLVDGEPSKPSVCIVTGELIGPFRNGGVGTAMTGLAETLADAGLRVTVLYTGAVWTPGVPLDKWRTHYAARGIDLVALTIAGMQSIAGPVKDRGFGIPWLVYRWLAEHPFDVIHFNDTAGDGSLSLAAKKCGLAFRDSLLVVALHSPSRWVLELNQILPSSLTLAAFDSAEKLSIASADLLWSPSRYLLDWIAARDYELPAQTCIQQYAIPRGEQSAPRQQSPVTELVFFGRLEERKGLRVFCNAVNLLRDELAQRGITVTFLGKPERCGGMPSLDYITRRAAAWTFPIQTQPNLGQHEALQYLAAGARLAVMPSPFDNSPCTVYEALQHGIPFLASRTGGIPELIDEKDRGRVLFEYSSESLRDALHDALEHGVRIARAATSQDETRRTWLAMHEQWRTLLPTHDDTAPAPLRLAAIIDHRAGDPIGLTLQSLSQYALMHRFIIINRSGEAMSLKNIDLLSDDPDLLETELAGIAEEAVLLIHSGVTMVPAAFDAMMRAFARTPVDGLLPAGRINEPRRSRIVPPLASTAFSLFEGVTFAGAMLMRREALIDAKRGRPLAADSPFMGLADYCVTRAKNIVPYPEPVFEHSVDVHIDVRSSLPARIAAYAEASPNDRYYMLAAGYSAVREVTPITSRRDLALGAVDFGLDALVRIGSRVVRRVRRWLT
jgi:glycosyltransferase involved in cell wall biosynthesis/predicted O-methyltransferase YrrM